MGWFSSLGWATFRTVHSGLPTSPPSCIVGDVTQELAALMGRVASALWVGGPGLPLPWDYITPPPSFSSSSQWFGPTSLHAPTSPTLPPPQAQPHLLSPPGFFPPPLQLISFLHVPPHLWSWPLSPPEPGLSPVSPCSSPRQYRVQLPGQ